MVRGIAAREVPAHISAATNRYPQPIALHSSPLDILLHPRAFLQKVHATTESHIFEK